jgi:uncharacterized protein YbjT (DUF2867 family)
METLMKILVTGGTGHLGRALVPQLLQRGHQLRLLARRPGTRRDVEWIAGDLASGEGLADAAAGMDIVIHGATSSPIAQHGKFQVADFFRSPSNVDVAGTRALLDSATRHGVSHFVHVSIVGLEETQRLPYSRVKLAAENEVRQAGVPWSIVRATGFYWLLDRLCSNMAKGPLLLVPKAVRMQPVDSDDFATWLADCALSTARGQREDFAGPEVLTMGEVMAQYLDARGLQRKIRNVPLPRSVIASLERGQMAPAARLGSTRWASWLAATNRAQAA